MTELEIALLGGLRLRHPDRGPIELAGEKGPQLLARLACPPGTKHRRDTLQALLWPDADPPHAQGNLRFVLHQLRKTPWRKRGAASQRQPIGLARPGSRGR